MAKAKQLADRLREKQSTGESVKTKLKTDQRVLARVTDGIYRQPASAIRELISNAYDADAENVWIQTDAPRFNEIVVADDGNGLTLEALADLVHHIGGSPKRTLGGVSLGITNKDDVTLSPGGRKLIGKIGIGLFAVAQLTRHFQVITKIEGENFRRVADVKLKSYSEEQVAKGEKQTFESGEVEIWSEKATDKDAHGTQVILMDIRDYTKGLLQSRERWERVQSEDSSSESNELVRTPPRFHIGSVDPETGNTRRDDACLPWTKKDKPGSRFKKLYQAILDEVGTSTSDPSIDESFDNYLKMLWNLGLAAPVEYVDTHPFTLSEDSDLHFFVLSNESRGQAKDMQFTSRKKRVKSAAGLTLPKDHIAPFNVIIDDIQLYRPIRFTDLPVKGAAALRKPMLFVGQCRPDLSTIPDDVTGGSQLSFEAYFFWTSKVVPKENNGVIVRIADASGSLFDDSFMHYEVAEQTRLRQITAEVFVLDGLDAALNIDRESFNYAHPHYQFLTRWVHRALRQVTNKHKELGRTARDKKLTAESKQRYAEIESAVEKALDSLGEYAPDNVADIDFTQQEEITDEIKNQRKKGILVFRRDEVFKDISKGRKTARAHLDQQLLEEKMKGVAQVLDAYGLLEQLDYEDQERLLHAICDVFLAGGAK